MAYGTRAHQSAFEPHLSLHYRGHSFILRTGHGETGIDASVFTSLPFRHMEMKSILEPESAHYRQLMNWWLREGIPPHEVRFLYYTPEGFVFEGIKQWEWSGQTKGKF